MSQCYANKPTQGEIIVLPPDAFVPCPSGLNCCGINDVCLSDNLCYFDHEPFGPGNYSGYYVATCTDPSFKHPACSKACTDIVLPDAVYDYGLEMWACCGTNATGAVTCQDPTTKLFPAAAPSDLTTIRAGASVSYSTTFASSTTATDILSSNATSTDSVLATSSFPISQTPSSATDSQIVMHEDNGGLSHAAKIGIGISSGIAGLLFLIVIAIWVRLRRSKKKAQPHQPDGRDRKSMRDAGRYFRAELGEPQGLTPRRHEKDGESRRPHAELE